MEEKTGNWWDKLGAPQYGGEITIRAGRNIVNFDPYFTEGLTNIYGAWLERLVADDWTTDPEIWNYQIAWHPSKFQKGNLAESWEFPDPTTHVIHLRQGDSLAKSAARQRPRIYLGRCPVSLSPVLRPGQRFH